MGTHTSLSRRTLNRRTTPTLNRFEQLESRQLLASTGALETPPTPVGTAIVRGVVFRDVNRNGIRESTEVGQPNIPVYLDYNNNGLRDGDAEPISVTNSLGGYRFENAKAPATIPVRLLLSVTNFEQTRPTNNAARVVTTTVGGNFELESFGVAERTVPPPPSPTVLTGIVYTDLNGNGARNDGEPGRANVSVYLDTNNDGARQDGEPLTKTNLEGRYVFTNIASGAKTIRLALAGTNLQQSQPTGNAPVLANVVANQVTQAGPFGVVEVLPPPTTAIVSGNVFYDVNENTIRDPGDYGRANVRVYVDLNNDRVRNEGEPVRITNTLGQYRFENVAPNAELHIRLDLVGTPLRQTLPTGNGARVLATVAGGSYGDQNFGVHENVLPPPPVTTGTIRGRVFADADHDGVYDVGEVGVSRRIVYLDLNHNGEINELEPRVLTNIEGRYVFERVPAGTYDVRLVLNGLVQTKPTNNGGYVATVVAGGTVGDLNFGVYHVESSIVSIFSDRSLGVTLSGRGELDDGGSRQTAVDALL